MEQLLISHHYSMQNFYTANYPSTGGQMMTAQSPALATSPSSDCCLLLKFLFLLFSGKVKIIIQ